MESNNRLGNNSFGFAFVLLIAILIFGGSLRSIRLTDSFWLDELHTSWTISDAFGDVSPRAKMGNNHPFYFINLWLLTNVLGQSEWSCRFPSYVAGVMLVGFCFEIARRWTGSLFVSFAIGILMAIDPNLIFYADEARPYALVQLFTCIGFASFLQYARFGHLGFRLSWLCCVVVAFYLHYTSLLLLTGQFAFGVGLLLWARRKDIESHFIWSRLIIDAIVIAVCCSAALRHLQFVAGRRENWAKFVDYRSLAGVMETFPTLSLVLISAIAAAAACFMNFTRNRDLKSIRLINLPVIYCLIGFGVPCLLALFVNNLDFARLFFRRYLVALIPVLYLLIAAVLGGISSSRQRSSCCILVMMFGFFQSSTIDVRRPGFVVARHSRENWRAAMQAIEKDPESKSIILRPGLIEDEFVSLSDDRELLEFCRFPISGLYRIGKNDRDVLLIPSDSRFGEEMANAAQELKRGAYALIRGRTTIRDEVIDRLNVSVADGLRFMQVGADGSYGENLGLYRLESR